jgi:hypothetical protein
MGAPIVIPHDTLVAGIVVGLFVALVAASVRIDALETDVAQLYRLDRYNRVAAETRAPCGGNSWGHEEQPGPPSAVMAQRIDPDRNPDDPVTHATKEAESLAAFLARQDAPDPASVVLSSVPREHASSP